jgi:uncharacterized protein
LTTYFFDTSALIKCYVVEIGSQWVVTTTAQNHQILISHITPIEMVSAFARRYREKALSERQMQAAMLVMERHIKRQYAVIHLSQNIETTAKDLLVQYPLRALDALQLATALDTQFQIQHAKLTPLIFVSADTRLLGAAQQIGLEILNPVTSSP